MESAETKNVVNWLQFIIFYNIMTFFQKHIL